MYTKSIFGVVFATLATFAVASPPACLIAALNEQKEPVQVAKICKDNAKDVQEMLVTVCKADVQDALKYFADTCKTSGVTVEPFIIPTTTSAGTSSTAAPTGTNSAGMSSSVTRASAAPNPTTTTGSGPGAQVTAPNSASIKVPSLAAAALLAAGIVFAV